MIRQCSCGFATDDPGWLEDHIDGEDDRSRHHERPLPAAITWQPCCPWSLAAHTPYGAGPGQLLRCPRSRWQALMNRLDHASNLDWPRLIWHAVRGRPL